MSIGSLFHEGMDYLFKTGYFPEFEDDSEPAKIAEFILQQYLDYYGDKALFSDARVESEHEFIVDDWEDGIIVAGKMDGVVRRPNGLYIAEHKTTGKLDQSFLEKTRLDTQNTLYLWAGNHLFEPRPKGIIYNIAVRPNPKVYRRKEEPIDKYLERAAVKYIKTPGLFFERITATRTQKDFDMLEMDMLQTAREIRWAIKDDHFRRNTFWCYDRRSPCDYSVLCLHGINARTVLNFERREPHCELTILKEKGYVD